MSRPSRSPNTILRALLSATLLCAAFASAAPAQDQDQPFDSQAADELVPPEVTTWEQVDAIRSMGADPVQKLVLPRVIAATLALPLLTVMADVLGVIGGMLLSWGQFGIDPNFYMQTIFSAVTVGDFVEGITKTFAFGWIIAMVGCFSAFRTQGGTVGVGRATTRTVVTASIAVLISDFFLTQLLVLL